jgi:hypothetical protein
LEAVKERGSELLVLFQMPATRTAGLDLLKSLKIIGMRTIVKVAKEYKSMMYLERMRIYEMIKRQFLLIIAPMLLSIPTNAMAQVVPGFSQYSSEHFAIQYPSDWSVNDTFSENKIGFKAPNTTAVVGVVWHTTPTNFTLDRDIWFNELKKGGLVVSMLNNDSNYLDGHPAIVFAGTQEYAKQYGIISDINGTIYIITYTSGILSYPKYLYKFDIMFDKFQAK